MGRKWALNGHVQALFPVSSSKRLWMQEKPDVYAHTPTAGQRHGTTTAQPHFHGRLPGGPRTLAKAQGRRIACRRPRANSGWPRAAPRLSVNAGFRGELSVALGPPASQPRGKATDSRPLIHGHSCSSERGTSRGSPSTSGAGLRGTAGFIKAPRRLGGPRGAETNPHRFFRDAWPSCSQAPISGTDRALCGQTSRVAPPPGEPLAPDVGFNGRILTVPWELTVSETSHSI